MRFLIALFTLFLIPSFVSAQSLAEIASKEKKRRASNGKEVEVVTDNGLSGDEAGPRDEPGANEAEPSDESALAPAAERPAHQSVEEWREEKQRTLEAWQERRAEYQRAYTEGKEILAFLLEVKAQCDSDAMPAFGNHPFSPSTGVTWGVGQLNCEILPDVLARVRQGLQDIQTECRNEARRNFIPAQQAQLH